MLKFLIKSAVWGLESIVNTPERKGARGERRVHNSLESALDSSVYRVLSDLTLPVDGGTTQIDHVIVSRFGVFVIETKNMAGWIFGSANQRTWTQVLKRHKRRFQNPVMQNNLHVKAVQKLLGVDQHLLHNLVVFVGAAEPKTRMPSNVAWGMRSFGRKIAIRNEVVLSENQVEDYVQELCAGALENTVETKREHVQFVQRKASLRKSVPPRSSESSSNFHECPRCGAKMVTRNNRKTGEAFLGCTKFPQCKGTRKL